ncbi:2Fe-2S iron-sulfur cluster binding domain-containing protein [Paenibacillus anaericanus]|uniref:2Fe-2S iron-sulfur cluster binding domain-containing protein n=1 Tax=Paenibacillus anaericanus TaxID=170367 RepID=A0A3S1CAP3_9BACL|nr:2Fe-2S iron-sulfur cluster-binding protein [Paenibacillus anaericanus]RUT47679.1 2Fe-2S iron-sulfur cluster binding domain-containing protein [Paenibacillus anaericanus]
MEYQIKFIPQGRTLKVRPGTSVLRAAREARVFISTRCDGHAGCLMCKVEVEPEHESALTPPSDAELRKLGPLLDQGIRLACQAQICGSAEVRLPEDPLKAAIRKQLERQKENDDLW